MPAVFPLLFLVAIWIFITVHNPKKPDKPKTPTQKLAEAFKEVLEEVEEVCSD
ncbi:MAG: hypothetical protein WA949_04070 [Phormidesmis sp.]